MLLALSAAFCLFTCYGSVVFMSQYGDTTISQSNVQSACNASPTGGMIVFPSNTSVSWSSSVTITNAISILGNNTTISASTPLLDGLFYILGVTNSSTTLRISGFNLVCPSFLGNCRAIYATGCDLKTLRIDHNTFYSGYTQVELMGCMGVLDHNTFSNANDFIYVSAGTRAQANASWADLSAGTGNAIFVEDCKFVIDANWPTPGAGNGNSIDGYQGGKVVFRHNEFDYDNSSFTGQLATIGFHGNASGGETNGYWELMSNSRRSPSVLEIYQNNVHGHRIDFLYTARGGANLIWSNICVSLNGGTPRIILREEEGDVSQWIPNRTNWPSEDQIHNTFIWGNTFNGVAQSGANISTVDMSWDIHLNRDYWTNAPQSSGGYEYFTGANGASGGYPTDGITYPTSGTMVFTNTGPNAYYGYVPYQYPHPLASAQFGPPAYTPFLWVDDHGNWHTNAYLARVHP